MVRAPRRGYEMPQQKVDRSIIVSHEPVKVHHRLK